ncbi:MAG: LysE family transporter, partial [Chloroflexi bacterium]|nr:LysE family transporter [Chloroflexota bacterium]
TLAPVLAGLGLGIALAGAPGPVQAILLSEALRGGVRRGFGAMLGANLTLGALLIALALGVSIAVPSDPLLRILKIVGGVFIIFLGVDGFRSANAAAPAQVPERRNIDLPPAARAAVAVILNPPAWLFLATAASSLMASATQAGGTRTALLAAMALLLGVAAGDCTLVLASGLGLRRARADVGRQLRRILALLLVALGVLAIASGLSSA